MSKIDDGQRAERIVEVLVDCFCDLMARDAEAFRRRFRRMAADPFTFYRGSACLFYADVAGPDAADEDRWVDDRTSRVWIQGDLHAQNFGTYMDAAGRLIFDVNDFDEAYLGHYTWDLKRFVASVALLSWVKALPDQDIEHLLEVYLRAYVDQVEYFRHSDRDHAWALTLETAQGAVRTALLDAQLSTRVTLLDKQTVVEDYQRRSRHGPGVRQLDDAERSRVEDAYGRYLDSIVRSKRMGSLSYRLKDVVGRSGFGVGSAGLPAFNLLVEGHTEALENDVVLSMKQGSVPAPSRVVGDERVRTAFAHQGQRTAVSQRALQAHSDPWLGWTELDGEGFVVAELSPYVADLDWSTLTETLDMEPVVEQLGRATAKVHCVSDQDSDEPAPLVEFQVEDAVAQSLAGREDEFVADLVGFGMSYGERARRDHALFVDAFRSGRIPGIGPSD